jgi:mono/diheme cytochrome c family protein
MHTLKSTIPLILLMLSSLPCSAPAQDGSGTPPPAMKGARPEPPTPKAVKGEYLATAGNCATCHTAEGGRPFAGGVAFPTPFGTIYSTNISQDRQNGIGNWSLDDFKNALRKGVRPDGVHLYPAFPYTSFTKLTDEDIAGLYAYMKTTAPVSAPPKSNALKFPFNQRALMSIWNWMFLTEGAFKADPDRSADWNRGAYLVEGLGHCGACHSARNFLGAESADAALTGGVFNDRVGGGEYRQWAAADLTSAKTGLAAWTDEDLIAYLKTGLNKRAATFGPMNDVVMNSTRHLTDNDIRAIATYLKSAPAKSRISVGSADPQTLAAGETVYTVRCGTCHLPSGLGGDGLGVPLAGSAVVQAPDPSSLINSILYGLQLPPSPFVTGRKVMTPLADDMDDAEIAQVASYVRASWGNSAAAVTAAQVAKQR